MSPPPRFPFLRPNPAPIAPLLPMIAEMEERRHFTNNGPYVRELEAKFDGHFGVPGGSVAVCNATIGLMLAIRLVAGRRPGARLALMPSFTFAATAQAAIWAGLEPVFCDIDPDTWLTDPAAEAEVIAARGGEIAVIVACATFGSTVDVAHYTRLSERTGIPVVVDAAASLGALDAAGRPVGAASPHPTVFSMHATKTFSVGEAGMVHCADPELIATIRTMANYGFRTPRSASMPGLNGKLSELMAILAIAKFRDFEALSAHRASLAALYRRLLPGWTAQDFSGQRQAYAFMPMLPPADVAPDRDVLIDAFAAEGLECGRYFHPHVADQPFFRPFAAGTSLLETERVASRVIAFPIWDELTAADVATCCGIVRRVVAGLRRTERLRRAARPAPLAAAIVGAGPGGTAVLLAASRAGLLPALLEGGLAVIEAGERPGAGKLAGYATDSDSAAVTFLAALDNLPEPSLAALAHSPEADAIRARGAGAVDLDKPGRLFRRVGAGYAALLRAHGGGALLTGTRALRAQQTARGTWDIVVRGPDGRETLEAHGLVLACGAAQGFARLRREAAFGAVKLLPTYEDRLVRSDELLERGRAAAILERLPLGRTLRVAVLGSGSGAVSSARLLLSVAPERFGAGGITVLHRNKLRLFYRSADEALAAGYTDWNDRDICPVSGFVNRLGGLRFSSADFVRAAGESGFARTEERAVFRRVPDDTRAAEALVTRVLAEADLVVVAFGYRPTPLRLFDVAGAPIELSTGAVPLVDADGRVRRADGRVVPGAWAIGLACGFRTAGVHGGEPSFSGQTNGLWLWQHDYGEAIARAALRHAAAAEAEAPPLADPLAVLPGWDGARLRAGSAAP